MAVEMKAAKQSRKENDEINIEGNGNNGVINK